MPGATLVYSDNKVSNEYRVVSLLLPSSLSGTSFRLIFTWQNDNANGGSFPASIDDVSLISSSGGPLSGVYSIDQTLPTSSNLPQAGSNFNSFTSAINYVNTYGHSGKLVFNVKAGQVFNDGPVVITFSGNASDTVVFQKGGSGSNPVVKYSDVGLGTADGIIQLIGANYIKFNGIDVWAEANPVNTTQAIEYGYYIRNASVSQGAQNNAIENCNVTLQNKFNSSIGIYIHANNAPSSLSGTNSFNLIKNVTIESCFNGFRNLSNASIRDEQNSIQNCLIKNSGNQTITTGATGISIINSKNIIVKNNKIKTVLAANTTDGILIQNTDGLNQISHNEIANIRSFGTSSTSGVSCGIRSILVSGASARIFNNMIYDISSAYNGAIIENILAKGISLQPTSNTNCDFDVDFNSVSINGQNTTNGSNTCVELIQANPTIRLRNNIFANYTPAQSGSPKHYAIVVPNTSLGSASSLSNYNNIYIHNVTNGFVGRTGTTNRASFTDWQTATSKDANSFNVVPDFVNPSNDLHCLSETLNGTGNYLGITWVTDDFDFQQRDVSSPDIGADEYTLVSYDLAIVSVDAPVLNQGCLSNNESVQVTVKNMAGQPLDFAVTPVLLKASITGPISKNLQLNINTNTLTGGPLPSLQEFTFTVGTADFSSYGTYTITPSFVFSQDEVPTNNNLDEPYVIENAVPKDLPQELDFEQYNGTNLSTIYSGWYEAQMSSPIGSSSSWLASSGVGSATNTTAKCLMNGGNTFNWIISPKIAAQFNTFLKFDLAITQPSALSLPQPQEGDSLFVLISENCGLSFDTIVSFHHNSNLSNQLGNFIYSLADFSGKDVIIAFLAVSKAPASANDFEFHLDNINLFNSNDADVKISQIISPINKLCFSNEEELIIEINNSGFTSIDFNSTPLEFGFIISGPNTLNISNVLTSGALLPGELLTLNLNDSFDFSQAGEYIIKTFVYLSGGDVNSQNDTLVANLISQNPEVKIVSSSISNQTVSLAVESKVFGYTDGQEEVFSYTGLPVAIPDGNSNGVLIPIDVTENLSFASQLKKIIINSINHQNLQHLKIGLVAPNGSEIEIVPFTKLSGTTVSEMTISTEDFATLLSSASEPYSGIYIPEQAFYELTGQAEGTWYLRIADVISGSIGSISSWQIVFNETNNLENYNWQSSNTLISGDETQALFNYNNDDWYKIIITDKNGCVAEDSVYLTSLNSNSVKLSDSNVSVYPNPFSDLLYLESKTNDLLFVEVFDITGKRVFIKSNIYTKKNALNLSELSSGFYLLRITDINQTKQSIEIIKTE